MTPARRDALLGLVAAAAGVAASAGTGVPSMIAAGVIGLALGLTRRHPRAAWLVTVAVLLAVAPAGETGLGAALLVAVHAAFAARAEDRWTGVAAFAALAGAQEIGVAFASESPVPTLLVTGAGWGVGRGLRERDQVAASLAERARELEEEREAHAALSVRYERARIASELHDIVAHAISVMVVQAAAGQRIAHDPAARRETFEAIAGAARQAEEDMGQLAALLGDENAIAVAPDLALVEQLVARAAGSGLAVTLRLEGEREGIPAPAAQAAYHVVQEGLTNALRYAAGAQVDVLVRGDRDALVVSVANGPAASEAALAGVGTGTGLQGLRERVGACGGTLEAGATRRRRLAARCPAAAPRRRRLTRLRSRRPRRRPRPARPRRSGAVRG